MLRFSMTFCIGILMKPRHGNTVLPIGWSSAANPGVMRVPYPEPLIGFYFTAYSMKLGPWSKDTPNLRLSI